MRGALFFTIITSPMPLANLPGARRQLLSLCKNALARRFLCGAAIHTLLAHCSAVARAPRSPSRHQVYAVETHIQVYDEAVVNNIFE